MRPIIEVNDLQFTYYGSERRILSGCSMTVAPGELVTILGPNGAGKSTLLNCACGLLTPQAGQVLLNGREIGTMEPREVAGVIGYVQQNQRSSFGHSVFHYVLMGRANRVGLFQRPSREDEEKVWEVLETMGIRHLAESSVMEISGGERQQAAIARAVAQDPQVIFFDEPTAHLDYGNQINTLRLVAALRDRGFGVVMTTHNPDHCMMLGGTVAILDKNGRLETGACSEILTEERLEQVYHTPIRLTWVEEVGRVTCIPAGL